MIEIKEVLVSKDKSEICNEVLRSLPDWFGCEESLMEYVDGVQDKPFYAVYENNAAIGFVSIKIHNEFTCEIYVIGIKNSHHRQGMGRKLVAICEDYCRANSMEFLTVKTLDASSNYEVYDRTRMFYYSAGFRPLEVFTTLWGESNPCLFIVKGLRS